MMTAQEARTATKSRLTVIAKEFIINNTGLPIQDAINSGYFKTTVSFEGVPNPIAVGEEVVRQLEDQGFKAKHFYSDRENHILISWEEV